MITAVILAMIVMYVTSGPVAAFITEHPTTQMLALAFLLLIGVALVAEGSTSTFRANTSTLQWPSPVPSRPAMCWRAAIAASAHVEAALLLVVPLSQGPLSAAVWTISTNFRDDRAGTA
jgi:predicted tellurium resistance membrane protein TerC